jgi:hypothetical protein
MRRQLSWALALVLFGGSGAFAQGVQTGKLSGVVKTEDGQLLPGATITIKSPNLLGTRTAVTDSNGAYIFVAVPPGPYTVSFELTGMSTVEEKAVVAIDVTAQVNATLKIAKVEETVTVTAESPNALNTTQGGDQFSGKLVDTLAIPRDPTDIALLAPNLSANAATPGNITIAGNFGYDNVFMIDGVDVDDNVLGGSDNLFIEDAIQETQVLTSGVSAEFGRFGGGVVNAITKSGGNAFSGSFRTDFTNASWSALTPAEIKQGTTHPSKVNPDFQATFGGPIVKDRLWFFLAGRARDLSQAKTLNITSGPYTLDSNNKREEVKLTGAVSPNHTLSATYVNNSQTDMNDSPLGSLDAGPATLDNRNLPNHLFVATYNGVLRSNLFVEAQYSQKYFEFSGEGGSSKNIQDSPFLNPAFDTAYNAPYFDATDPETRQNRQLTGALSYFLTTKGMGRHDLKLGYENFRSTRTGGNSQSSTNFVFITPYEVDANGNPVLTASGDLIPVFQSGVTFYQNWLATRGARLDLTTQSVYLNDKVQLNNHLSFNLGVRYEKIDGSATGGIKPVNTSGPWAPRLAVSYDVNGDGKFKLDATYAHYAGGYNAAIFGTNTNVGNPNLVYGIYNGPTGTGKDFGPGTDPSNYSLGSGFFPTANVFFAPNVSSPVTKEYTFSAGAQLPHAGFVKAVYTHRHITNFLEDFVSLATGTTTVIQNGVNFGTFQNTDFQNSDFPTRIYSALTLQAEYKLTDHWGVSANYTHQFKNFGNFEGEALQQVGNSTLYGNYPGLFSEDRNYPSGNLSGYQADRVRAWSTYNFDLGKAGAIDLGALFYYDSPVSYSLVAPGFQLTSVQVALAAAQGYTTPLPASQPLYFGSRGSQFFNPLYRLDLAVNYQIPVFKSLRPWFKFQIENVFNYNTPLSFNTAVTPNTSGPVDSLGLPLTYTKGAQFGQATNNANFAIGQNDAIPFTRTYQFALGFRF